MRETVEYILRDMGKKKHWGVFLGAVLILSALGMKLLADGDFSFSAEDFFMIAWFFLSLYDIWFLAEASSGELCDQTLQILYAAGCRRTEFSALRLTALYLQGMLTGTALFLWYALVIARFWPPQQMQTAGLVIVIYGLIHGILGTLDRLMALWGAGRALLVAGNAAVLIVLPVALSTLAAMAEAEWARHLFENSLFGLVLDAPVNLSLGSGRFAFSICTGILLGVFVLHRENRKDF